MKIIKSALLGFCLALMSVVTYAACPSTLPANQVCVDSQSIGDVYVDDNGNLGFGVKVEGVFRTPHMLDSFSVFGVTISRSMDINKLKNLCVWNIGTGKNNNLRFQYTGSDKKAVLARLLSARMNSTLIEITYTPSLSTACGSVDVTSCTCTGGFPGLAIASAVVLQS